MHTLTVALLAQLALTAQLDEDRALAPVEPPVACQTQSAADLDAVVERLDAPTGGRWWLPRHDDSGAERVPPFSSAPLEVVDGSGAAHLIQDLYETQAALSLRVPDGVEPGAVLQLRHAGAPVPGVVLRVAGGEVVPSAASISDVTVTGTTPDTCDMFCRFQGMTVAAAPLVSFTFSGSDVILDAWWTFEGGPTASADERVVDSQLLSASDAPTVVERRVGEVGFTSGLDVRVRLLDPNTLDAIFDETFAVAPLPEVPAEDVADVPLCEEPEPGPLPLGCAAGSSRLEAAWWLAFALVLLARRRSRPASRAVPRERVRPR